MSGPDRSLVIVAGGRSRRLGCDKPLVEVGDRTVLSRILEATAHFEDTVLAVREVAPFRRALAAEGWELPDDRESAAERADAPGSAALHSPQGRTLLVVPDPVPDLGPLAGLASGLDAARGEICVALAGDLPFVTSILVDHLSAELARDAASDAIVPHARGRPQPLCGAYRRSVGRLAARLVERAASSGGPSPSMMGFLDRLRVRTLTVDLLAGNGDLEAMVRGVDSRADLEWARHRAARSG